MLNCMLNCNNILKYYCIFYQINSENLKKIKIKIKVFKILKQEL